ncbi:MFS transporter [Neobacillus kokaensis]|uniref:MFS transporter n=1 Tax=Neobacillus kokaensis TaxID=2759023 RepID=A0ABQ3N1M1_9BACI|nr:MFS transporter [Neobacillus kokaensis]GHH98834.1 MFS transporter [Neobacillus kokaensis]
MVNQVNGNNLPEEVRKKQVKKAAIASIVGTSIEWYDFFLYGTMAALVFPRLFFPDNDPYIATLQSFATFFVGFLARPIGAAVFGAFGDKIGRKATLVATLLFMGISSTLIGLVPSHEQIGVAAPILLVLLRFCQGIGVGGEWGGSVVLSTEWSPKKHRGLMGSMTQLGVPIGLFTSTAMVSLLIYLTGDSFYTWGWRIPFLISLLLVGFGLYIRNGVMESPQFTKMKAEKRIAKKPVLEVIKNHPKEIMLTSFARLAEQAPFYIFTTWVITYGVENLKLDEQIFTNANSVGSILELFCLPLFAFLSDRFNRKKVYVTGCILTLAMSFPFFWVLDTGNILWIFIAIGACHVINTVLYGPQAALIAESFPTHLRYSGASLGYQCASLIGGGIAPMICVYLLHKFGSTVPISLYIIGLCIISTISVLKLKDYSSRDMGENLPLHPINENMTVGSDVS